MNGYNISPWRNTTTNEVTGLIDFPTGDSNGIWWLKYQARASMKDATL